MHFYTRTLIPQELLLTLTLCLRSRPWRFLRNVSLWRRTSWKSVWTTRLLFSSRHFKRMSPTRRGALRDRLCERRTLFSCPGGPHFRDHWLWPEVKPRHSKHLAALPLPSLHIIPSLEPAFSLPYSRERRGPRRKAEKRNGRDWKRSVVGGSRGGFEGLAAVSSRNSLSPCGGDSCS